MRALVLFLATLFLAGCSLTGDDGGSSVPPERLKDLVLQPSDLSSAFFRFDEGRQGAAEAGGQPGRFGREGGWKARYRRAGTAQTRGPLVVASLVDLYQAADGAEEELAAVRAARTAEGGWKAVEAPDLGDEAFALTTEQGIGASRIRFFYVAWRDADLTASVEANGFSGGLVLEDVVALARKQARRIADTR
jgi:hypothetical protein